MDKVQRLVDGLFHCAHAATKTLLCAELDAAELNIALQILYFSGNE